MQAFGKGGATLSLFKALNFKVYEALGIEMGPKYFVKGEASINKSNLETCPIYKGELKGTLGAKGKARVSMDVFSKTLAEFTKDDFPIGELSLSISKPFELTLDNENCPPKDPPPSNCGGSVRSIGTRCY